MKWQFGILAACLALGILSGEAAETGPEKIVVLTRIERGFGPFTPQFGRLYHSRRAEEEARGVPEDWRRAMVTAIPMDRSVIGTAVEPGSVPDGSEALPPVPNPDRLAEAEFDRALPFMVPVTAGLDRDLRLALMVDEDQEVDFTNEYPVRLAPPGSQQTPTGRYQPRSLFYVKFSFRDGEQVRERRSWIYLDYAVEDMRGVDLVQVAPVELTFAVPEHRTGSFSFRGERWSLAVNHGFQEGVYRLPQCSLSIRKDDPAAAWSKPARGGNEFSLGEGRYRFDSISADGSVITIVKVNSHP